MTLAEAQESAVKWEADIASSRESATLGRDKALSSARAQAGASGVRKGTQSWDTMMYNASSGYDAVLQGLTAEELSLKAYNASLAGMSSVAGGPTGVNVPANPGDTDNTDTGLDQAGTGSNMSGTGAGDFASGFAMGITEEVASTVASRAGFGIAGLTGAAIGAGLPGVVGGFMNDELESPFSATSPMEALKDVAEIGFAAVTGITFDVIEDVADFAIHATTGRTTVNAAEDQSIAQAKENNAQGYNDPTGSGSDMGGLDNEGTNTDANTAAGEQSDAQAAENEAQGLGGDRGGGGNSGGGGAESEGGGNGGADGADGNGAGESDGGANGGEDGGQSDGNGW